MVQLYSRVSRSLALPISTMPRFIIPLADKLDSSIGGMTATFTRNSTATYIDPNGVLQTAAINVPRFQNGRYLVEPAATNKSLHSINFTNSTWVKTTSLINANVATAPDGTTTASKIIEESAVGYPGILQGISSVSSGTLITQSWFVKASERSICALNNYSGTFDDYAFYDLGTKECGILINASGTVLCGMDELEDGWFRIWMKSIAGTQARLRLMILRSRAIKSVTGDGVSGLYIWGVQNEEGISPTSYIPTTTVPMDRVADVLYYDVSSVITQGQGSLYFEFVGVIDNGYIKMPITISDGTANNRFYPYITNTGTLNIEFWTSGVLNGMSSSGVVSLELNKTLITYKTGEVKLYNNGILLSTKTTVILPLGLNKLNIGSSHAGHFQLNSEIGNVQYFKEVLTPLEAIKQTTL